MRGPRTDEMKAELTLSIRSCATFPARRAEQLKAVLNGDHRTEAMEITRSMIERTDLHPRLKGKGLDAVLHGDLGAILAACEGAQDRKRPGDFSRGAFCFWLRGQDLNL